VQASGSHYRVSDLDLLPELAEAHLDTIGLRLADEIDFERRGHLGYVQALVRQAQPGLAGRPPVAALAPLTTLRTS
jgi:hypothetical protein